MAIKVGEAYVEIFPNINHAMRQRVVRQVAQDMRKIYNDSRVDETKAAQRATNDTVRIRSQGQHRVRQQYADTDRVMGGFFRREAAHLHRNTKSAQKHESIFHKMATGLRTIGTLLRASIFPAALLAGWQTLELTVGAVLALLPLVNAGLAVLPAALGGLATVGLIIKTAFKGVGDALAKSSEGGAKFQDAMDKLTPSAQRFVRSLIAVKKAMPDIQETFFAGPKLREAESNFGRFASALAPNIKRLTTGVSNMFGSILTNVQSQKNTANLQKFLDGLHKSIQIITPGLNAVITGLIHMMASGSGQGAKGLNTILTKMGEFFGRVDVPRLFDKARQTLEMFKPLGKDLLGIFAGIGHAMGGNSSLVKDFFQVMGTGLRNIRKFVESSSFKEFVTGFKNLMNAIAPLVPLVASLFGFWLGGVAAPILIALTPLIRSLTTWLDENQKVLHVLIIVWTGYKIAVMLGAVWTFAAAAAHRALSVAVGIARVAITLATGAQWLWNAAMAANPIGAFIIAILAVAAGLFFFFKNLKTVTTFLRGPWGAAVLIAVAVFLPFLALPLLIITYWGPIKNFFTKTVPSWFKTSVAAVMGWFNWLTSHIVGWWNAIYAFLTKSIPNFFTKTVPNWVKGLAVGWMFYLNWLKNHVVGWWNAVYNFLTKSIPNFLTKTVVHWVQLLATGWMFYFNWLKNKIVGWWGAVYNFFTRSIPRFFTKTVPSWAKSLATQVLKQFDFIFTGIKTWWKNVHTFLSKSIPSFFTKTIPAWGRKMANTAFVDPVNWIIDRVVNKGIRNVWVKLDSIVGGILPDWKNPVGGIKHMATGGLMRGPGGPREDKIPAMLSNNEFVVNAAATKNNLDLLYAINSGMQFAKGGLAHFAKGGLAWPSIVSFARHIGAMSGLNVTSTTGGGHAPNSWHYKGMAVDVAGSIGAMNAAAHKLAGFGRYMLELIHDPGVYWKKGKRVGKYGGPHADHIHIAMTKGNALAAMKGQPSITGDGFSLPGILGKIWGFAGGAAGFFKNMLGGNVKDWDKTHPKSGLLAEFVHKGFPMLAGKIGSAVTSKLSGWVADFFSSIGGFVGDLFTGKSGQFDSWYLQAAKAIGAAYPGKFGKTYEGMGSAAGIPTELNNWKPYIRTIAQKESGFNPNAINRTDSNAARGDPSRGIMQTIGGTFSAFHVPGTPNKIFDPVANIAAAIMYIKYKYGSVLKTPWFTGKGTYYNQGGLVRSYDMGGVLSPGYTLAYNGTGANEYVSRTQPHSGCNVSVYIDGVDVTGKAHVVDNNAGIINAMNRRSGK